MSRADQATANAHHGDSAEPFDAERDGREPRALQQELIQSRVVLTIGIADCGTKEQRARQARLARGIVDGDRVFVDTPDVLINKPPGAVTCDDGRIRNVSGVSIRVRPPP